MQVCKVDRDKKCPTFIQIQTWSLFWSLFIKDIWKHTNVCTKGVFFLSLFSCNFNDQLSPNFHRFASCICMLGCTKWEYWSLTIKLPKVSSTFEKHYMVLFTGDTAVTLRSRLKCLIFDSSEIPNGFDNDRNNDHRIIPKPKTSDPPNLKFKFQVSCDG